MKKSLVILFLVFLFTYSYAGQEEEKGKVVIIDPDDTNMIENWPQWLFLHGYTSYYDSNWMNNYRKGHGAIVLRKQRSFGEAFLDGLGKGISKGIDNYYRTREQKQDIEFKMGLLKLKWASEGYYSKPKYSQPHEYRNEYRMSPQEERANRERIIELDRIIKLKKERANLDKLFREAGWLDKDRIEYLDKYYPLPSKIEKEKDEFTKYMRSIGATRSGDKKIEKPEDDIVKFARPQGAMLPWEHKTKKLNEYLKARGLSPVPTNVEVHQVHDGDWIIFWDGEKWARRKQEK